MAANSALAVVRQIQGLAEGPPTPEMRECLGQVVSALLFFLEHPDSRVRLGSTRTLLKLCDGYPDQVRALDLSRAKTALARSQAQAGMVGDAEEAERQEMVTLLTKLLGESPSAPKPKDGEGQKVGEAQAVPRGGTADEGRGEVVLKVGAKTDSKVKAAILERVVKLAGVVSVTFEGEYVVVNTRTRALAADASFLADVLLVIKEQGLQGVQLVAAAGGRPDAGRADASPAAEAAGSADDEEEAQADLAYLDDEEGGAAAPPHIGMAGMGQGGANWSFFAQTNWMTGRQIQEFGDDPSIAARLREAKRREEEKRQEQQSRIGRLASWFTGGQ